SQPEFTSVGFSDQATNGDRMQVFTLQSQQYPGATFKTLMQARNNTLKPLGRRHVGNKILQQLRSGHGVSRRWVIKTRVVKSTMKISVLYTHLCQEPTVGEGCKLARLLMNKESSC